MLRRRTLRHFPEFHVNVERQLFTIGNLTASVKIVPDAIEFDRRNSVPLQNLGVKRQFLNDHPEKGENTFIRIGAQLPTHELLTLAKISFLSTDICLAQNAPVLRTTVWLHPKSDEMLAHGREKALVTFLQQFNSAFFGKCRSQRIVHSDENRGDASERLKVDIIQIWVGKSGPRIFSLR